MIAMEADSAFCMGASDAAMSLIACCAARISWSKADHSRRHPPVAATSIELRARNYFM